MLLPMLSMTRDVTNVPRIRYVPGQARTTHAPLIEKSLRSSGLVFVDGLENRNAVAGFADGQFRIFHHPDSSPDGVTSLADRGLPTLVPGQDGFGRDGLPLHTERSSISDPPHLMLLVCVRRAATGGRSLLADGKAIYDSLAQNDPALLQLLLTHGTASFGDDRGYLGAIFERLSSGRTAVRLRRDGLVRFDPRVAERIDGIYQLAERHQLSIDMQPGQGCVLDNRRWLHGRTAFAGNRLFYRVLGDPLPHLEISPGFEPASLPSAPTATRTRAGGTLDV